MNEKNINISEGGKMRCTQNPETGRIHCVIPSREKINQFEEAEREEWLIKATAKLDTI